MDKIIAYCGLVCSECEAYIATQAEDDEHRKEVAERWSKDYNREFKWEDINCDGCVREGRHVLYCSTCPVRQCGQEQGVINCAWCGDYPCEKLQKIFEVAPACKKTLDEVKQWIG